MGERTRFVDLLRRTAAFTGVEVLAYCFMTNHFLRQLSDSPSGPLLAP